MVRLVIEDVTLLKEEEISLDVRFRGGAVRSFLLPKLRNAWQEKKTPPAVVAEIDRLLNDHTDGEIADILNKQGLVSGCGHSFDGRRVRVTRRLYGLRVDHHGDSACVRCCRPNCESSHRSGKVTRTMLSRNVCRSLTL